MLLPREVLELGNAREAWLTPFRPSLEIFLLLARPHLRYSAVQHTAVLSKVSL